MFKETLNTYLRNIKKLSVVALIQVFLSSICYLIMKYFMGNSIDFKAYNLIVGTNLRSEGLNGIWMSGFGEILMLVLIAIIITPYIGSYSNLVIKKVLRNEEVVHKKCLKEASLVYWRYVGLNILISLIILVAMLSLILVPMLFSALPIVQIILTIIGAAAIAILSVILRPIIQVMVYDDLTIREAIKVGKDVGIQYFMEIVGIGFVLGLFSGGIGMITENSQSIIVFAIAVFFIVLIENLIMIYYMFLYKEYKEHYVEV